MARLYKRNGAYYGDYFDHLGIRVRRRLSPDRRAAQAMLQDAITKADRTKAGIIDHCAEHAARPLSEHLREFSAFLRHRGRTGKHVALTEQRISTAMAGMKAVFLSDLRADRFAEWLAGARSMDAKPNPTGIARRFADVARAFDVSIATVTNWRRAGAPIAARMPTDLAALAHWRRQHVRGDRLSDGSVFGYVTALKMFSRWLQRSGRVPSDPLAMVSRETAVERCHVRRSLSPEQFQRLLGASEMSSRVIEGFDGPTRSLIYSIGASTGLRRAELGSLTARSLDLGDRPVVTLPSIATKNRRGATIPLSRALADRLDRFIKGKDLHSLLFPGLARADGAAMIRHDLETAEIPYRDDEGRVYDFHALRGQLASDLARANVPLTTAMKLLRHSDPRLTASTYTSLGLVDLGSAIDAVESLRRGSDQPAERVSKAPPLAPWRHRDAHGSTQDKMAYGLMAV